MDNATVWLPLEAHEQTLVSRGLTELALLSPQPGQQQAAARLLDTLRQMRQQLAPGFCEGHPELQATHLWMAIGDERTVAMRLCTACLYHPSAEMPDGIRIVVLPLARVPWCEDGHWAGHDPDGECGCNLG